MKKLQGVKGYVSASGRKRIEELEQICAESYQVMALLADEAGRFDDPHVIKALDNLSQIKMVHDDVLPFPSKQNTEI